jgi:hypothetical protein
VNGGKVKACLEFEMKRPARFVFVHQRVRAQIPRASESLISIAIEAAVRFYKRGRYFKVERLWETASPILEPSHFVSRFIDWSVSRNVWPDIST